MSQPEGPSPTTLTLDYAPPTRPPRVRRAIVAASVAAVLAAGTWLACDRADRPGGALWNSPSPKPRVWHSADAMHDYFVERFVASDGFGGGRRANTFSVSSDQTLIAVGQRYRINSVELISLDPDAPRLRRPAAPPPLGPTTQPFAYTAPMNVSKSALQTSPRRPLSPAEQAAVAKLHAGNAAAFDANGGASGAALLVGAIRASADCAACHPGARDGRLLSAFSYRMTPAAAAAAAK